MVKGRSRDIAELEQLLNDGRQFDRDNVWYYFQDETDLPTAVDNWIAWQAKAEVIVSSIAGDASSELAMVHEAQGIDVVDTAADQVTRSRELIFAAARSCIRRLEADSARPSQDVFAAREGLLHHLIREKALPQFRVGHLRDAVLNSFIAVFDLIRLRTGIDRDGSDLVTIAFSLTTPRLIISTLETESGRSEQKGFIQILQGTYQAIRNPKAHSLASDLTEVSAWQYLVFASLLARRVEESRQV